MGVTWETHRRRPNPGYERQVQRTLDVASRTIPAGSRVLVVSGGDERLLSLAGCTTSHFPRQDDGTYAGHHPADAMEAVTDLERWRRAGFRYLVVPAAAGWWLDHYSGLRDHLSSTATLAAQEPGACVVYALREGGTMVDTPGKERVDAET